MIMMMRATQLFLRGITSIISLRTASYMNDINKEKRDLFLTIAGGLILGILMVLSGTALVCKLFLG